MIKRALRSFWLDGILYNLHMLGILKKPLHLYGTSWWWFNYGPPQGRPRSIPKQYEYKPWVQIVRPIPEPGPDWMAAIIDRDNSLYVKLSLYNGDLLRASFPDILDFKYRAGVEHLKLMARQASLVPS